MSCDAAEVVGEWLQSCDGQTGTAGSGAVDDAAAS